MDLLINVGMAWLTVILMVLLSVIYLFRRWIQEIGLPKDSRVRTINRRLRKPHKWLGLAALATGLVHGIYSSAAVISPNKGTILWVVFILMGLSWMFRKNLSRWKPWIKVHRMLCLASAFFLVLHVLEVGGFVGVEPLMKAIQPDLDTKVLKSAEEPSEVMATDSSGQGEQRENRFQRKGMHGKSTNEPDTVKTSDSDIDLSGIPDGIYTGVAEGFQPGLTVEVHVLKGMITEVVVVEHNEIKEQYWGRPVAEIPAAIVVNQSADVDVVSGATFTSIGIMNAVKDAIAQVEQR